jgi:hypothetical protein
MLKNLIRKKLVETKFNKNQLIIENKIVKKKLEFLFENHNLYTKKQVDNFLINLLIEMVQLYKKGYNSKIIAENVTNVFDVLKNLFGDSENKVVEIFKIKGIDWILEKLDLRDEETLVEYLKDTLMSTELSEVPQLLSDCDFLSKKIAKSVKENYLKDIENSNDGEFMTAVKETFHSVIQNSDIETRLESKIYNLICPLVDEIETKFEQQLADMKSKLVKTDGTITDIEGDIQM